MRFMVTGASGFIGSAIARQLVDSGHEVRAFIRPFSSIKPLEGRSVKIFRGDLSQVDALRKCAEGCDGIFHAAAIYSFWSRTPSRIYEVNVEGSKNVMKAALDTQVKRVVFTSSVATLKWHNNDDIADETNLATVDELPGYYKKSKLLSEQAVIAMNDKVEVVVVNPSAPFGPWDIRPTPTGRIIMEFLTHRFPMYVDTGMNVCDVDDVADGHISAFHQGKQGERYLLGSENLTLRRIYQNLSDVTGLKRYPVKVPWKLAFFGTFLNEQIRGRLLKQDITASVEAIRIARHAIYISHAKASRDLGYNPRPAKEAIRRGAEWFRSRMKRNEQVY